MNAQLSLFETTRSDVIVPCALCRRPIIAQHYRPGVTESEYRNAQGECYECDLKHRINFRGKHNVTQSQREAEHEPADQSDETATSASDHEYP